MPLSLTFISPGNYTIEDNGIPGDNTSVIKDGNGAVIFTFIHPADSITFTAGIPGVNLTLNFTDSLGVADLTIGSLTNPSASPDSIVVNKIETNGAVTLVATGSITERGSDSGADIIAGDLILSAGTGIGTGANAIETRVNALEGETNTGGINLSNLGTVVIGGITDQVNGLDVATSGNLTFTAAGTIFLSEEDIDPVNPPSTLQSIHGGGTSGNVTLIANGSSGDIFANTNLDAISAPRGNIVLQAGRDVTFGTASTNFDNDVRASGSITINAGRDFLIDGFSDLVSDDFGQGTGGGVAITTGRNIHLRNVAGTDAGVTAGGSAGADVVLTTGTGGAVILDAESAFALSSNSGDVTVNADRVVISAASGITASLGTVTLRPMTQGREMILGSGADTAAAVELSNVELDRIFSPNFTVGSNTTGNINVALGLALGNAANLTLRSGEDIFLLAGISTTSSIALIAGNNLFHQNGLISTGTLTAQVDASGDDEGVGGFGQWSSVSPTGTPTVASVVLNGGAEADTLRGAESVDQTVHGNGGNDTITSSGEGHYFGDEGNDTIIAGLSSGLVPEALDGGNGVDTLDVTGFAGSYTIDLAAGTSNFGYESFVNFENVTAGSGADTLAGTSGVNIIRAGDGNDTLIGGSGADTLDGGAGNDKIYVDNVGDVVIEAAGGGIDRVFASVSYTLGAAAQVETLSTTDNAGTAAINLAGNGFANSITGNAGANTLIGGAGADTLSGLGGNDRYYVDNVGDVVVEAAGGGSDRVFASVSYTLGVAAQVETLSTTDNAGTDAINLAGNGFANSITGNAGANTLIGGAGADTLSGLGGNDRYYVDNVGDVVVEAAGGGSDRVFASVSYSLGSAAQVEILSTTDNAGTGAINLTGNGFANSITGNAGANVLDGLGGSDTLNGLGGADTFRFTTALGAGNVDTITGYSVADDGIQLENAVFTGLAAGALAAGAFNTGAAASQADDRIIYNSATGALLFDVDGVGGAAGVQFATLAGGLALTASEFLVI